MRTLRLAFPLLLTLTGFAACRGGGLVPSDAGPQSGGATGSGGAGPGSGGDATGSGGLGGDGNLGGGGGTVSATGGSESGSGGDTGSGGNGGGCAPRVHLLIQRSGGMFNFPAPENNWWDAVSAALDGDEGLLGEFGSEMQISASIFTKVMDEACPLATSVPAPVGAGDLVDVLQSEADDYFALTDPENPDDARKVDAPVVEAVEAATTVLADAENAYIVLVASGNPDSCEENDNPCISEDVFRAVQAAHDEGIQTRLVYLQTDSNTNLYPEGVANAGIGAGLADLQMCSSGFEYSDTPGSAPFGRPDDTAGVEQALSDVLTDIAACN